MNNPFEVLEQKLDRLQSQLSQLQLIQSAPDAEVILNAEEAAQFMGISRSALYQNIDGVPHAKKFGRLYFFKSELLDFLKGEYESPTPAAPVKSIRQTRKTRKRQIAID